MNYIITIASFAFMLWLVRFAWKANQEHLKKLQSGEVKPLKKGDDYVPTLGVKTKGNQSTSLNLESILKEAGVNEIDELNKYADKAESLLKEWEKENEEWWREHNKKWVLIENHDGSISSYERARKVKETARLKWFKEKLRTYSYRGKTWEDHLQKVQSSDKNAARQHWWFLSIAHRKHFEGVKGNIIFDTWEEVLAFKAWLNDDGPPYQKWNV